MPHGKYAVTACACCCRYTPLCIFIALNRINAFRALGPMILVPAHLGLSMRSDAWTTGWVQNRRQADRVGGGEFRTGISPRGSRPCELISATKLAGNYARVKNFPIKYEA